MRADGTGHGARHRCVGILGCGARARLPPLSFFPSLPLSIFRVSRFAVCVSYVRHLRAH